MLSPPAQPLSPAFFTQHVLLYNVKGVTYNDYLQVRRYRALCNSADRPQPLERAEMVREGKHCTILTYSRMRRVTWAQRGCYDALTSARLQICG